MLDPDETCDDGNRRSGDGCSSRCLREGGRCGDGMQNAGEECDDGNDAAGDGCAECRLEFACGQSEISDSEGPALVAIPPGEYPVGNAALSAVNAGTDRVRGLEPGFCAIGSLGIEQSPTGPLTWEEARSACERRGRRLPDEREWEVAFRLRAGDGSDMPNPLGLDYDPDRPEWTSDGVTQREEPLEAGSRTFSFRIIKNWGQASAMCLLVSIDQDETPEQSSYRNCGLAINFRCVR